ncbi:hypothetical protein BVRB_6g147870 [Beta vulgaris subsp. vulgaris]|nr:hypothetical protein BVRB_6g147870 [Beta vulgaris subsp. vulgaris]
MASYQIKVFTFAACLIAMAVIVSAHNGHNHADSPSSMLRPGGRFPNGRDSGDSGALSPLAPFAALMVALVGFAFSFARI